MLAEDYIAHSVDFLLISLPMITVVILWVKTPQKYDHFRIRGIFITPYTHHMFVHVFFMCV